MTKPLLHVADYPRTTFRPRHLPVIVALTEAFFAHDDEPLDPARLERFAVDVDAAISTASKSLRFGLLVMLDVIEWTPLFILGQKSLSPNAHSRDGSSVNEQRKRGASHAPRRGQATMRSFRTTPSARKRHRLASGMSHTKWRLMP